MSAIVQSLSDTDLIFGNFSGQESGAPVRLLLGHAGKIVIAVTAYNLRLSDSGKLLTTTSASATTITVLPATSVSFNDLAVITWVQMGAGQITFAAGDGVTIRSPETLKAAKQYASGVLIYLGSDEWLLSGNLEAV